MKLLIVGSDRCSVLNTPVDYLQGNTFAQIGSQLKNQNGCIWNSLGMYLTTPNDYVLGFAAKTSLTITLFGIRFDAVHFINNWDEDLELDEKEFIESLIKSRVVTQGKDANEQEANSQALVHS